MLNLAEYRKKPQSLADFLPWAALVAEDVVLNKDGSLQRTTRFRGPDLDSATPAELVGTTARLNNALRRLGSGWAIFVEASRDAAQRYPQSEFPHPVSTLVDAERKAQFEEKGVHFETAYYLTFLFLPPAEEAARAEAWLYEGLEDWSYGTGRSQQYLTGAAALAGQFGLNGREDLKIALIDNILRRKNIADFRLLCT